MEMTADHARIAVLTQLHGIGINDATVWQRELFKRDFANRRR